MSSNGLRQADADVGDDDDGNDDITANFLSITLLLEETGLFYENIVC